MTDSILYSIQSTPSGFSSQTAAVDPCRIQPLLGMFHQLMTFKSYLAQASARHSSLRAGFMPDCESSALEDFISSSASNSSNPDLTASLSSNIFEALLDYVNQSRGLPPPIPSQSNNSVVVFVDGIDFAYQLTDDDLVKVFVRYGTVSGITIGQDGTSAMVTFASHLEASRAVSELNGKRLGVLRQDVCVLSPIRGAVPRRVLRFR